MCGIRAGTELQPRPERPSEHPAALRTRVEPEEGQAEGRPPAQSSWSEGGGKASVPGDAEEGREGGKQEAGGGVSRAAKSQ